MLFCIENTSFELLGHHSELNQLKSLPQVFFSAQSVLPEPSYDFFWKNVEKITVFGLRRRSGEWWSPAQLEMKYRALSNKITTSHMCRTCVAHVPHRFPNSIRNECSVDWLRLDGLAEVGWVGYCHAIYQGCTAISTTIGTKPMQKTMR